MPIVVSTWKDEATNDFRRECKKNNVLLLENEMPEERGCWNVNLQLKSSLQGVKFIQENTSAKFVLKTRTDQRINYFHFLIYFKNLLETFPPKGDKLRKRIIFMNSTLTKNIPFHFSDFLSFGHVADISRFYDVPFHRDPGEITYAYNHIKRLMRFKYKTFAHSLDHKLFTKPTPKLCQYNRITSRFCSAEDYIAKNFYRKYIAPIDETKLLETNWKFIADYTILIDDTSIFMDWFKYERSRYKTKFNWENSSAFEYWLDLYRNFKIDWV